MKTVEPKTVEELLDLNNATRFFNVLIEAGYDDIKYICETSNEELQDIGIDDSADREQVIYNYTRRFILIITCCFQLLKIFADYASKYRT